MAEPPSVPTPDDPDGRPVRPGPSLPNSSARPDVRCPRCHLVPPGDALWTCDCGHRWDCFRTRGQCPTCGKSAKETRCPACDESSPHVAWYGKPRRRRRRSFRFTREGKIFVAVTVGVGLAAVNTGNNLLYLVLGLMLSSLLVSGMLSDVALWRIRLHRRAPRRAFAGDLALVEFTLVNDKQRLPSYALEVEDVAVGERTDRSCFFLKVAPSAAPTGTYRRRAKRRGLLRFTGAIVRTRYPFGLIEKGRTMTLPGQMLVYPAIVPVDLREVFGGHGGDASASRRTGRGAEVAGLREYQEGDEARAIHWRRTAALGRLIVRERLAETRAHLTLLLDNGAPEGEAFAPWAEGFEVAVSEAASIAQEALAAGASVEVRARDGSSPVVLPGSPPDPILRWLALLGHVPSASVAPPRPAKRGHSYAIAVHVQEATAATDSPAMDPAATDPETQVSA